MPRYFFHLHNDIEILDEEGRECADLDIARREAFSEAREMAARSVREGHLKLSHSISVTDSAGETVVIATFGDAVRIEA